MQLAPHVARRASHVGIILVFATTAVLNGGPRTTREARAGQVSREPRDSADADARWAPVRDAFQRAGVMDGGALRITLPRTDLHVRVGSDTLAPRLAHTSEISFAPSAAGGVTAVGELSLRRDEVDAVVAEAGRQRVRVIGVHDDSLGETPRTAHVTLSADGEPNVVATRMRAVLAITATPLGPPSDPARAGDWSALDATLGAHAAEDGDVVVYTFRRRAAGAPSHAAFETLGGGRTATAGAVHVLTAERDAVADTLRAHGLRVLASHPHLPDDGSTRVWVHWYAVGDGSVLARGVAAALARTSR